MSTTPVDEHLKHTLTVVSHDDSKPHLHCSCGASWSDQTRAMEFLIQLSALARQEGEKAERERMRKALNPNLKDLQYIGRAISEWHRVCEDLQLEVVWQDTSDEVLGQRQRPIRAITHSPLKAYHEVLKESHHVK